MTLAGNGVTMSNRNKWAHWKDPKPDRLWRFKQWPLGIAFTALGGLFVAAGLQGLHDHVLWFWSFNWILGRPTIRLAVFRCGLNCGWRRVSYFA